MTAKFRTFLMFQGDADEAMQLYTSVFGNAERGAVERYGDEAGKMEGLVVRAELNLGDHQLLLNDSSETHDFDFTPSTSLFVDVATEEDLQAAFDELSEDGEVLMPLDDYGFSQKFAWITDRFGVSWQLNLP